MNLEEFRKKFLDELDRLQQRDKDNLVSQIYRIQEEFLVVEQENRDLNRELIKALVENIRLVALLKDE